MPLGGLQTPDIAGFVDAQQRLRARFGEQVWFVEAAAVTFPPDTNIDPNTGYPFDPAIAPVTSGVASASAQCDVFFRAISRGGTGHEFTQDASDVRNTALMMIITDYSNRFVCQPAETVYVRGSFWKIMAQKPDGIGSGTQRWLIYVKDM